MTTKASKISISLDLKDRRLLALLEKDARQSYAELAKQVGLSRPTVVERIRDMEANGVIKGYTTIVSREATGRPLLAMLRISASGNVVDRVAKVAKATPEVLECHRGTGSDCFIMKIMAKSLSDLEAILDKFTAFGQLTTTIVLSTVKETTCVTD